MQRPLKLALVAVTLLAPLSALASDGYVNGYVNLRAGPGTRYPRLMTLQPGTAVAIHGCINGWRWCDVGTQGERGWIDGSYLQYPYGNRRVALSSYGSQIGIPIVSFILGAYWGDHYSNRSWYGERQRWSDPQYRYGQQGQGYRPQQVYRPQPNYHTQPNYHSRRQDYQHPQPGGQDHGHGPQGGGPGQRGGGPGRGGNGQPQGPNHGQDHGGHKHHKGGGGGGG